MNDRRKEINGLHGNNLRQTTSFKPGDALNRHQNRGGTSSAIANPLQIGQDNLRSERSARQSNGGGGSQSVAADKFYKKGFNDPRASELRNQNASSWEGNGRGSGSNSQHNNHSKPKDPISNSRNPAYNGIGQVDGKLYISTSSGPQYRNAAAGVGKDSSRSGSKFGGSSKAGGSKAPAQIPARSRLSPLALQTHQKDKSLDRFQGTSADNAVAIEDDSDEETPPSAPLRRRNDSNVERGLGSRTSNGNGRDARGQEKGKGRSYDSDPDQGFDGAVGDDSTDPLDFLTGQQSSRRMNPLPSFTKKASGMKAKNGLKVGDEIVDVDIEEGKKGGLKKKNQQNSASTTQDFTDNSYFIPEEKSTSSSKSKIASAPTLSAAKLKAEAKKVFQVSLINFYLGEEYEANPEHRFDLVCHNDVLHFRKITSGESELLFDFKMGDMESAEMGKFSNGCGQIRLRIEGTDTRLGKKISSRFKDWRLEGSRPTNRDILFVVQLGTKTSQSDNSGLCTDDWTLLQARLRTALSKKGRDCVFAATIPVGILQTIKPQRIWPDREEPISSSTPRTTRKSGLHVGPGGQSTLGFKPSDGSAKKSNPSRAVSTPQPIETKPRPKPRAAVSGRKSESATMSTSNSKNQKGTPSYVNTVDDPCVIDSSDEEEADKSKQASTSKTPSSSRQGAAANTRMARRANAGPAPEEIKIARFPTKGLGGVTVSQADLDKLKEGEFLNDTIVEFGLKYLHEGIKARDPVLYEQIYIFSSFFHKRLSEGRREKKGYEFVKKWTNRVNIFDKKYLVIPINEHLHWYLAIIVNPSYIKEPSKILLQQKQAQEQEKALRAAKAAEAAEKRASRSKAGRQSEGSAASTSKIFELPHEDTRDGVSVPQPVLNEVGNGKGNGKSRASENGKDVEMKDAQNESQVVDVSDEEDQDNDDPQAGAGTDDPSQLPRRGRAGQVVAPQSPEFEAGKQEQGGIRERFSEIKDKDGDHRMRTSDSQRVLSEEEDELEGDQGSGSQLPSNSHPQFVNDDLGGPEENQDDMDLDGEDTISLKSGNADDDDPGSEITDSFSKPSTTRNRDQIVPLFGRSPSGSKPSSTQQKENGNGEPSASFNSRLLDSDFSQPQTTSGINGIKVPVHDVRSARTAYSNSSSRSSKQARRILDSQHQEDEDMENPPLNYASDHSYKHSMNGSNPGNGPLTGGGPLPDAERETSATSTVVTPPPRDSQASVNQSQAEAKPLIKRSQSLSTDKEPSQEPPLQTQTEAQPLPQAESESEPAPQQQPQASTSHTPMDLDESRADSPPVRSIPDKKKNKAIDSNASAQPKKKTAAQLADESKEPILVVLDSLGGLHKPLKKALENWLQEEAKDKAKIPEDKLGILHLNEAKAPLQPNFCDCGIYLIHYFDRLFRDPETLFPLCYAQDESQEKREHPSWEAATIETKRQYWKDTILSTGDEWKENLRIAQEKEDEEKRARRDAPGTSKNAASTSPVTPPVDAPEQNDEIDGDQMDVDPDLDEAAEVEDEIIEVQDPSSKSKGKGKEKEQSRARSRGSEDEREASEKGNKRMRRDAASPEIETEIPRAH